MTKKYKCWQCGISLEVRYWFDGRAYCRIHAYESVNQPCGIREIEVFPGSIHLVDDSYVPGKPHMKPRDQW